MRIIEQYALNVVMQFTRLDTLIVSSYSLSSIRILQGVPIKMPTPTVFHRYFYNQLKF